MSRQAPRHRLRPWGRAARGAAVMAVLVGAGIPAVAEPVAVAARFDGPTTRYPHGALGDDVEFTTLTVTMDSGTEVSVHWAQDVVFEDTVPLLADVDGDGAPEIIVTESHARQGARMAVYRVDGEAVRLDVATPFIGTRFRWLSRIGAADLDGDGAVEIAYIDRPHLAKTLRVWRYDGTGVLTPVDALAGLTNHRIGDEVIEGGIRSCPGELPQIVTADANWSFVQFTTLEGGALRTKRGDPYRGAESLADALICD